MSGIMRHNPCDYCCRSPKSLKTVWTGLWYTVQVVVVFIYLLSCVQLFVSPWTVACQDPLSLEFSRQEYWSGWPFPFPGDLPNLGVRLRSPAWRVDSLPSEPPGKPQQTTGDLMAPESEEPAWGWQTIHVGAHIQGLSHQAVCNCCWH